MATPEPTPTETSTEEPTPTSTSSAEPTATATEMAYLGGRAGLAAPMLIPGSAPALAPLAAPATTTHRVISYTYDALYRLISATYRSTGVTAGSTGEYFGCALAPSLRTESVRATP